MMAKNSTILFTGLIICLVLAGTFATAAESGLFTRIRSILGTKEQVQTQTSTTLALVFDPCSKVLCDSGGREFICPFLLQDCKKIYGNTCRQISCKVDTCQGELCGGTYCVLDGEMFSYGDTRAEDCNTCTCMGNDKWTCTDRACIVPDCETASDCSDSYLCENGKCVPLAPVCSYTGEKMNLRDPNFLGIIVNEMHSKKPYEIVSTKLAEANFASVRKTINWRIAEPEDDQWDYSRWHNMFMQFAEDGMKVRINLGQTPQWASTYPDATHARTGKEIYSYFPPADMEEWDEFVRESVLRYKDIADDWEVWLEPDWSFSTDPDLVLVKDTLRDTQAPVVYVDMLNRAAVIIRELDPGARVWGPDVITDLSWERDPEIHLRFIREVLKRGDVDGVNIHTFSLTVPEMVDSFNDVREFMDANGGAHLPLIVTAAQIGTVENSQCPYLGMTLEEEAQIMNDIYVCLANAGAGEVYMYKSTDIDPSRWNDNRCLPETERSGIFGVVTENYPTQPAYYRMKAIGDYINR